jgi:hypothetical protein
MGEALAASIASTFPMRDAQTVLNVDGFLEFWSFDLSGPCQGAAGPPRLCMYSCITLLQGPWFLLADFLIRPFVTA